MPIEVKPLNQTIRYVAKINAGVIITDLISRGYEICVKQSHSDRVELLITRPEEQTWVAVDNDQLDWFKAKLQDY